MDYSWKFAATAAAIFALAACNASSGSASVQALIPEGPQAKALSGYAPHRKVRAISACNGSRVGKAQCDALVVTGVSPNVSGYAPSDLQAAYNLPSSSKGAAQIVAVVDAYDNPNVATDLAAYRSLFGLPTVSFRKFNQDGQQRKYPAGNTGWGLEIDLDVEMVSASCPLCAIYLIEANSNSWSDIEAAEAQAVSLGATIVSNSFSGSGARRSYFDTRHITYLASTGDSGYGISDPADFPTVVAVGGTSLTRGGKDRGWIESVWNGSGAGCSTKAKPAWQHDPGCKFRTADDVSAIADPYTGVAEYDTYGQRGWLVTGGTSVSAPLVAGVFALAGNSTQQQGGKTFWNTRHQKHLYPIVSGSDGTCGGSYLCTAGTNQYGSYSGPGGWGSPNGIGAF